MELHRYDGVIIGGGHNALVCGSYLAKAGLRIAILEERFNFGGGALTVESKIPYFKFNLHAFSFIAVPSRPPFSDLGLGRYCRLILHPAQITQTGQGNKSLTIHTSQSKSAKSVARLSPADGRRYEKVAPIHDEILDKHWVSIAYTDPTSRTVEDETRSLRKTEGGRLLLSLDRMTAIQAADEEWETQEMKAMWALGSLVSGVMPDQPGSARMIASSIPLLRRTYVVEGGSGNFVRALMKTFLDAGGELIENSKVSRVIFDRHDVATGVELSNGSKIMARKFVASSVDAHQSFFRFVGRDRLDRRYRQAIDNLEVEEGTDLALHFALKREAKYTDALAGFNPDIQRSLRVFIGFESLKDIEEDISEIRSGSYSGNPDKQRFQLLAPTKVDPSQAPPGRHTALIWDFVKCRGADDALGSWEALGDEFAQRDLGKLRRYAPNMGGANILDVRVHTPLDYTREFSNMVHGALFMRSPTADPRSLPHYKTPFKNYYLCGSTCYPGGGITGAPGYIAANIIADDLGLEKWWKPVRFGSHYALM